MSTPFNHRIVLALACLSVVSLTMVLFAPPALGAVTVISANVGGAEGTPLYSGASAFEWSIPQARMADGFVFGTGVPYFDMSPLSQPTGYGSLVWTGNPLVADQSITPDGLAIGQFGAGGVFSMTGNLYDAMGMPAASGLLFSGSVSAFTFAETGDNQNNMELRGDAIITPTGGWLFDQGYLAPQYELSFQAVPCQQDGGDVVGFASDIITFSSMQFFMVGVPEPSAALLLSAGALLLWRPRRKS